MLVAHADESYEEWGYSGSLVYEPGADDRGTGVSRYGSDRAQGRQRAASRICGHWRTRTAWCEGAACPSRNVSTQRSATGSGAQRSGIPTSSRTRLGLTLTSGEALGVGLEFGRRESVDHGPEDAMLLRGELRFYRSGLGEVDALRTRAAATAAFRGGDSQSTMPEGCVQFARSISPSQDSTGTSTGESATRAEETRLREPDGRPGQTTLTEGQHGERDQGGVTPAHQVCAGDVPAEVSTCRTQR